MCDHLHGIVHRRLHSLGVPMRLKFPGYQIMVFVVKMKVARSRQARIQSDAQKEAACVFEIEPFQFILWSIAYNIPIPSISFGMQSHCTPTQRTNSYNPLDPSFTDIIPHVQPIQRKQRKLQIAQQPIFRAKQVPTKKKKDPPYSYSGLKKMPPDNLGRRHGLQK